MYTSRGSTPCHHHPHQGLPPSFTRLSPLLRVELTAERRNFRPVSGRGDTPPLALIRLPPAPLLRAYPPPPHPLCDHEGGYLPLPITFPDRPYFEESPGFFSYSLRTFRRIPWILLVFSQNISKNPLDSSRILSEHFEKSLGFFSYSFRTRAISWGIRASDGGRSKNRLPVVITILAAAIRLCLQHHRTKKSSPVFLVTGDFSKMR
jgi:hypothetical protein